MFDVITLILFSTIQFIWSIPLILLNIIGIQLYKVTDTSEINTILNKLKPYSSIICNNKADGFIYGRWYIGYFHIIFGERTPKRDLYMLLKKGKLETIIDDDDNKNNKKTIVRTYNRMGCYWSLNYKKRDLDVTNFHSRTNQLSIIKSIEKLYFANNKGVYYIHGDTGIGKSMVGYLVAKQLGGSYCDSWNPTEPSDSIDLIYSEILPTVNNPLVLILEEFDKIIDSLDCEIPKHKWLITQVHNKTSWNGLLDKISLGIYPNLILILTSNKTPDYFNKKDTSYIRKGRVDKIFHLQ